MKKLFILVILFLIGIGVFVRVLFLRAGELPGKLVYRTIDFYEYYDGDVDGISTYKLIDFSSAYKIYKKITIDENHKAIEENINNFDIDPENLNELGHFNGAMAFSNDGRRFAANCEGDVDSVCVIRLKLQNPVGYLFSGVSDFGVDVEAEIPLPEVCEGIVDAEKGIDSISWSPNGERLLVVCGKDINNFDFEPRFVCVVDIDGGEWDCLEDNKIYHAFWSPVSDEVLLMEYSNKIDAYGGSIYLSSIDDLNQREFLFEGSLAQWSPDGKKIVFSTNRSQISIFSLEDQSIEIFYDLTKDTIGLGFYFIDPPLFTWSPDGQYIAFQGRYGLGMGMYGIDLFILDTKSREFMIVLPTFNEGIQMNPAWGK